MKRYLKLAIFFVAICATSILEGQAITFFDGNTTAPTDCASRILGESVDLIIGDMCGPEIGIIFPDGSSAIARNDTTIVLDQIGQYEILCNTVLTTMPVRTFDTAGCIDVAENAIPTMGEWGVIILILLIFITAGVSLRTRERVISEFS